MIEARVRIEGKSPQGEPGKYYHGVSMGSQTTSWPLDGNDVVRVEIYEAGMQEDIDNLLRPAIDTLTLIELADSLRSQVVECILDFQCAFNRALANHRRHLDTTSSDRGFVLEFLFDGHSKLQKVALTYTNALVEPFGEVDLELPTPLELNELMAILSRWLEDISAMEAEDWDDRE